MHNIKNISIYKKVLICLTILHHIIIKRINIFFIELRISYEKDGTILKLHVTKELYSSVSYYTLAKIIFSSKKNMVLYYLLLCVFLIYYEVY